MCLAADASSASEWTWVTNPRARASVLTRGQRLGYSYVNDMGRGSSSPTTPTAPQPYPVTRTTWRLQSAPCWISRLSSSLRPRQLVPLKLRSRGGVIPKRLNPRSVPPGSERSEMPAHSVTSQILIAVHDGLKDPSMDPLSLVNCLRAGRRPIGGVPPPDLRENAQE